MKLTELEREVLQRLADGRHPRDGLDFGGNTRIVSQALRRLHRKGALDYVPGSRPGRFVTEAGRAALAQHAGDAPGKE